MLASACRPAGQPSVTPKPPAPRVVATVPPEVAYAEATRPLDPATCEALAAGFRARFEADGEVADRFNEAVVWHECGADQRARAAYEEVVSDARLGLAALDNLGAMSLRAGDFSQAMDVFEQALDRDWRRISSRLGLAAAWRMKYVQGADDALPRAVDQYRQALALDASSVAALGGLAHLYLEHAQRGGQGALGRAEIVLAMAQKSLRAREERSADILNLLGVAATLRGDETEALRAFRAAVEVDPDHGAALYNAGVQQISVRDYAGAAQNLRAAEARLGPSLALGVAERGRGDFEAAEAAYARYAERDPDDPRVLFDQAILALHRGAVADGDGIDEAQAAIALFERFIPQVEGDPAYADALALARVRLRSARTWLEPAVSCFPAGGSPEAVELEQAERRRQAEERVRLLELERQAWEALRQPPKP